MHWFTHHPFRLLPCLLWLLGSHQALAAIDIYTTARYPAPPAADGVSIHYLDTLEKLEKTLFPSQLSDSPVTEQQLKQQIHSEQWQRQEAQLTEAWQSIISAWQSGVHKVPAVVFDGRYVVYGTTDVVLAQQKLAAFQEKP